MVTTFNVRILPGSFALGRPQPQTAFVCLSRDAVRLFQLKGRCRAGKIVRQRLYFLGERLPGLAGLGGFRGRGGRPPRGGPHRWDQGQSKLRCRGTCRFCSLPLRKNLQAAFFSFFCRCCGYVGNAFALSKRSGISTASAGRSAVAMPLRHTFMGCWLLIA